MSGRQGHDEPEIDPEDFLRALLRITPEDAAKVREDAAEVAKHPDAGRPEPDSD